MSRFNFSRKLFLVAVSLAAIQTTGYGFNLLPLLEKMPPADSRSKTSKSVPDLKTSTNGFQDCKSVFYNGKPPVFIRADSPKVRELCFDGFATLYSSSQKIPVYSAAVLNKTHMTSANRQERTNLFFEDARLPKSERATLDDYKGSKFDRGHQYPAGDTHTPESMAQSFSLANMVPEAPDHNRNLWSDYESATRKYVKRASGDVYVVTGSIVDPKSCTIESGLSGEIPRKYDMKDCTIGNRVSVPSHIYKVVFDPSTKKAWAYWTVNSNNQKAGPPISYSQIVKNTGIDFFPGANLN